MIRALLMESARLGVRGLDVFRPSPPSRFSSTSTRICCHENVLLNPAHSEFESVGIVKHTLYTFDESLPKRRK